MHDNSTTVQDSQVDWLTATALEGRSWYEVSDLAVELLHRERERGNVRNQWSHQGYKGWTCGRVDWGFRRDSAIIRLRGALSHDRFDDVARTTDHFTRVDLAVTTRHTPFDEDLAKGLAHGLDRNYACEGFRPTWELREHSSHGDTLYLGSRTSQFYARLYNKQRESRQSYYQSCWRWEVECKQAAARNAAAALAGAPDRRAYIQRAVHNHFAARHVPPSFLSDDERLPGASYPGPVDTRRAIAFLGHTVAPLMEKFRGTQAYPTLLQALGLDETTARAVAEQTSLQGPRKKTLTQL